jgi:hypothetical protein
VKSLIINFELEIALENALNTELDNFKSTIITSLASTDTPWIWRVSNTDMIILNYVIFSNYYWGRRGHASLLITSSIEKKTISPILPKFLILINSKPATLTHFTIIEFEHSNTLNQHKKNVILQWKKQELRKYLNQIVQ